MIRSYAAPRFRHARSLVPVIVFLIVFVVLLVIVSHYYLIPAMKISKEADPKARKLLSLDALLMMVLMLFILLMGLLMTFRIGRYFRPKSTTPSKPTVYVDAWKESGRRLKVPEKDEKEEGE